MRQASAPHTATWVTSTARTVGAVTVILVLMGVTGCGHRAAAAHPPEWRAMVVLTHPVLTPEEQQLLDLINANRQSHGLPDLQVSTPLENAARWKAAAIAARGMGAFTHDDIEREWYQRLIDFGYPPDQLTGENIGASEGAPLEALMEGWKASPPHDANLRGETWRYIGIARAEGTDGVQYWVLDFGEVSGEVTSPADGE